MGWQGSVMQYQIHHNLSPSREQAPYVLDVQSTLLDKLATRVVIPLYAGDTMPFKPLSHVTPVFPIENKDFYLLTPFMAAMPSKWLGDIVLDCRAQSHLIVSAIDALLSGI